MTDIAIKNDKKDIDNLVKYFFSLFTNKNGQPKIEMLRELCIDEVIISKASFGHVEVYNLDAFIKPRLFLLTNGKLVNFEEMETCETTVIKNSIAQRTSEYKKEGILDGVRFSETGTKMFHFLKINGGWKISSLIWHDN